MHIAAIRDALTSIRNQLITLTDTNKIVYDSQPLVDMLREVINLVERNGVPSFDAEPLRETNSATTEYFNALSENIYRIMLTSSRIIDELTGKVNESLTKYAEKVNLIEPIMEDLRQRIDDLEKQTLEKITNTAIHDHEVKNINFMKNIENSDLTIINNSLLLPIISQIRIPVDDISLTVLKSEAATSRLDGNIVSTEDKTDSETIVGTYFGNLIGLLDGSESFTSEDDFSITSLYNKHINEVLDANFYTYDPNDEFKISIESILNDVRRMNFVSMSSNVAPEAWYVHLDTKTILMLKNNIFVHTIDAKSVTFTLDQQVPERIRYHGMDVIDKATSTVVKRHNYFNSMKYLFPDVLESLNDGVQTTDIVVTPQQITRLSERQGFYKYHIDVSSIDMFLNTYNNSGYLETGKISTSAQIVSVEIEADQLIPGDDIEYVRYEISFDRNTWHPIKTRNEGITKFNIAKKRRIVLNNDNNDPEFLFIGEQPDKYGLYLRVNMASTDAYKTPAIYNIQLKVKVESSE